MLTVESEPPQFPESPPLASAEYCHDRTPRQLDRREFCIYSALTGIMLGVNGIKLTKEIADTTTEILYPPDEFEVEPVAPNKIFEHNDIETWVFGGYGVKKPTNAARELYDESEQSHQVAAVGYTNQGLYISDLGKALYNRISERNIQVINIEGASMGANIAIGAMFALEKIITANPDGPVKAMPLIEHFFALSSPADIDDAYDGKFAPFLSLFSQAMQRLGIEPDISQKMLWSFIDGEGDIERLKNFRDYPAWKQHFHDSIAQTFNNTPIKMTVGQMKFLAKFNLTNVLLEGEKLFTPGFTKFYYCASTDRDTTIHQAQANQKFSTKLDAQGIETHTIYYGAYGHANTAAAARSIGPILAARYNKSRRFIEI